MIEHLVDLHQVSLLEVEVRLVLSLEVGGEHRQALDGLVQVRCQVQWQHVLHEVGGDVTWWGCGLGLSWFGLHWVSNKLRD